MVALAITVSVPSTISTARAQTIQDFSEAVKADNAEPVGSYLAGGGDPNVVEGARNLTLLHWAAFHGSLGVVKILIEAGATVNAHAKDPDWMPLHYASYLGHSNVVTYLLDHGAWIDQLTSDGSSALSGAAFNGQAETARLLLARGADGGQALVRMVTKDKPEAVRLLLDSGVDPNATPRTEHVSLGLVPGETALFTAVDGGNPDVVSMLLGAGADPNIASPKSVNIPTPLMMAVYYCDGPMIDLLIAAGASRSATSQNGDTAASLGETGWTNDMQPCPADIIAKVDGPAGG
jgi:ankyrin repeat protein